MPATVIVMSLSLLGFILSTSQFLSFLSFLIFVLVFNEFIVKHSVSITENALINQVTARIGIPRVRILFCALIDIISLVELDR